MSSTGRPTFIMLNKSLCSKIKSDSTADVYDYKILPTNNKYRWDKIEQALRLFIRNPDFKDFQKTVFCYNESRRAFLWAFDRFTNENDDGHKFNKLLADIAGEALRLPQLFKDKRIPILCKSKDRRVTFSEEEICCLLANALFCTFTDLRDQQWDQRKSHGSHKKKFEQKHHSGSQVDHHEHRKMPSINFFYLLGSDKTGDSDEKVKAEKLKCIFQYFQTVIQRKKDCKSGKRRVTFHRQVLEHGDVPDWQNSKKKLVAVDVQSTGLIEDQDGLLQVDFANKIVGGGVLRRGCVQEEIRFVVCPELIASRLIAEELDDNDCIVVTGVERFSKYTGYSNRFKFDGAYSDNTQLDDHGRMLCQVLMIDAINFWNNKDQFEFKMFTRELNKAYCGFRSADSEHLPAVATGNWGCGAFNGNKDFKFLIQLLASSEAGRDMRYLTFDDEAQTEVINSVCDWLKKVDMTVGELYCRVVKVLKSMKFGGDIPSQVFKTFGLLPDSAQEDVDMKASEIPIEENPFFGKFEI